MISMGDCSQKQMDLIHANLRPGEKMFWAGAEPRLRYLLHRLSRLLAFTTWAIFAGLWAADRIAVEPDFLRATVLESLPILLPLLLAGAGSAMLAGNIFFPGKTGPDAYAVTDRRALLVTPGRRGGCRSYPAQSLGSIQVRRRPDGSGEILFERGARWISDPAGRATLQWRNAGFFGLEQVDEVCRMLKYINDIERYNLSQSRQERKEYNQ